MFTEQQINTTSRVNLNIKVGSCSYPCDNFEESGKIKIELFGSKNSSSFECWVFRLLALISLAPLSFSLSFWLTMIDDFSDSDDESSVSTSPSTPFIFLMYSKNWS